MNSTVGKLLVSVATLMLTIPLGCRLPVPVESVQPTLRVIDPAIQSRGRFTVDADLPVHKQDVQTAVQPVEYVESSASESTPAQGDFGHSVLTVAPGDTHGVQLSLHRLIEQTLVQNPDLHSAAERISVADATLCRARAEFFPRLGLTQSYGVSNIPQTAFSYQLNQRTLDFSNGFVLPDTTDDFHTQLIFEQEIYTGGRRTAQALAARSRRDAALYDLTALHNKLIRRVAESYYRLLQAHNLVRVRTESVRQVEQHLHIVQSRYDAGQVVKSDVLAVQVRLAEVREALARSQNNLQLAWAILENVCGGPLEQRVLPSDVPAAPCSEHVDDVAAAIAQAVASRPEIGRVEQLKQAASHDVCAAVAGDLPTVGFVTDYDVYTGDFVHGNDAFFTGLVIKLNLFDAGRTGSDVRRAEARLRELQANQRRLVLDIELDVRRACLQLADAKERVELSQKAVAEASESLREVEAQYGARMTTVTRLIDSQVALSNARVRHANAQADVEIARMALDQAIGQIDTATAH